MTAHLRQFHARRRHSNSFGCKQCVSAGLGSCTTPSILPRFLGTAKRQTACPLGHGTSGIRIPVPFRRRGVRGAGCGVRVRAPSLATRAPSLTGGNGLVCGRRSISKHVGAGYQFRTARTWAMTARIDEAQHQADEQVDRLQGLGTMMFVLSRTCLRRLATRLPLPVTRHLCLAARHPRRVTRAPPTPGRISPETRAGSVLASEGRA